MSRSLPVMKAEASLARWTAARAISSGRPRRPSRCLGPIILRASSMSFQRRSMRRVSTAPGEIVLARMPCPAWSAASTLASWMRAPLLAQYAGRPGEATRPSCDAMRITLPPPRAIIAGIAALAIRNAPREIDADHAIPGRLVHLQHGGGTVAVGGAVEQDGEIAEALDGGGDGGAAAGAVRHVERHGQGVPAALLDLGRGGLGPRLLDVGAGHVGAGRREREGGRAPDPVGRADDDGRLPLEGERRVHHRDLLIRKIMAVSPLPR